MATSSIKGITIEIGGNTTKLGKALEDVNKKSRNLQRELKNVNTLLKYDPDNVELLNQKQQILNETIANTREKLETLKNAQQQVQEQFERGEITTEQYRSFQREIIATENKLESLSTQLQESERSMDGLDDSADDLTGSLDDIESSADSAEDGFTILKGTLADLASNAIQAVASKLGDLVSSLFELAEATEEFRMNMAKLDGASEQYGYSQEFVNNKIKEMYGYFKDDQVAVNTISNLEGLKLTEEELSAALDAGIAVWTAYGDSIPIEGLTESINESAQVAQVTGSLADALNWAGISEDDFNNKLAKCNSTKERAQLITDTLNQAYGKSKQTYDESTESLRENNEAEMELMQTQADLGEAIEPLNTAIINVKIALAEALTPAIETICNGIMNLINWFNELSPAAQSVIQAIGIVAGGIGIITGLVAVFQALAPILAAIKVAFLAVIGVIGALSTPVLIAIGVITSLISIGTLLYKNWGTIKANAVSIWNSITSAISNATNTAKNVVNSGFKLINTYIVNPIKSAYNTVTSVFSNIYNTINTKINNAKDAVRSAIDKIKGFFNFKFSWPKLSMPHFSISPSGWKAGDLLKGSIPKLSVDFYANGGIMDGATLFGMNGNSLMVGGESGKEAILPLDSFYDYVDRKLDSINTQIDLKDLSNEIKKSLEGTGVYMDGKKVGTLLIDTIHKGIIANEKRANRLTGRR